MAGSLLINTTNDLAFNLTAQLGGLSSLAAALDSPERGSQESAAGAIWYLSKNRAIQDQLRQLAILPALIRCLQPSMLSESAAGAVKELAQQADTHQDIVSLKGPEALLGVFQGSSLLAQESALGALLLLAQSSSYCLQDSIPLKAMTQMLYAYNIQTRQHAVSLLTAAFASSGADQENGSLNSRVWSKLLEGINLGDIQMVGACLEHPVMQLPATGSLAFLAKDGCIRPRFATSGLMQNLILKLETPEPHIKNQARTVAQLVQEQATTVIADLVQSPACAAVATQPAGLKAILQLFHLPSTAIKAAAFQIVDLLTATDQNLELLQGHIDTSVLGSLFCSSVALPSLLAKQQQARLLHRLCKSGSFREMVISSGSLHVLISMLASDCLDIQLSAMRAVAIFLDEIDGSPCCNADMMEQLVELGGLQPLIELLSSSSEKCQAHAAMAIGGLGSNADLAK